MTWRLRGIATVLLNAAVVAAGPPPDAVPDKPLAEQGYAGLELRDIPGGHTVASWIFPGPLEGEGLTAPKFNLARPDLIVSVDGEPMTAEQFKVYVRSKSPGETIVLEYRLSNARGGTIPEALNHQNDVKRLEIALESREEWTGTIGRERGHDSTVTFEGPTLLDPDEPENVLGAAVAEQRLTEPLRTLLGVFTKWQAKDEDYHSLSRVRAGFDNPFCLPQLKELITKATHEAPDRPIGTAINLMVQNVDLPAPTPFSAQDWVRREQTLFETQIFDAMHSALLQMQMALGERYSDEAFAEKCLALLRVPHQTFYLGANETKQHVAVLRQSMSVKFGCFAPAIEGLGSLSGITFEQLPQHDPIPVPDWVRGAVEGEILSASFAVPIGWVVIGSDGPNRYDMAKIAGVIDPGGDDEYYATGLRLGTRAIIDLAGDDLYTGTPEQGPGSALLGVSFIDDRAGNDRYEGELLSAGAAMFGVSLLLDRGGNDIYVGREWSLGAACYGAGMIFDLGDGNDQYLGDFLCEGVGGPRGFGCIIDEKGRDLYRANGPTPSAYETPAVYQSFSQGIGFGFRNYAAGGIGLISDLGGDDRYEAGEFAQGGAYYYGLGILHDAKGRDIYYGNRYGQGFGVHQAIGILADDEGDDTYWSMTAASQGAAWDIGVGLLIDRAGNDSYQADGLAQGSASMQAIGMLIDLGGVDRYVARGGATHGQSGGDAYHYHKTGAFSFSLLLDAGGGNDWYSTGRANNATISTGRLEEDRPHASSLHGLFVDR